MSEVDSGSGCNVRKCFQIETRFSDEQSVDVRLLQKLFGIGRRNGAAVEQSDSRCLRGQLTSDEGEEFLCLRRRCAFSAANSPDGLIGDDDAGGEGGDLRQLLLGDLFRLSCVALSCRLTDAENGNKSG